MDKERQPKLFRATGTSCNQRRPRQGQRKCLQKKWWEDGMEEYREGGKRRQRGEIKRKKETEGVAWRVRRRRRRRTKDSRGTRGREKERERDRGKVT